MTDPKALESALAARGWRYDAQTELFMEGERQLDWEEVLGLLPGLKREDLVAYQEAKWKKQSPGEQRRSQASL
jgi:hypothetical protein